MNSADLVAQVTDAMVDAGHNGLEEWRRFYVSKDEVRAILTAAIGADNEPFQLVEESDEVGTQMVVASALAHPVQPGWRPTHRHVKRGSEYMLIGIGKMQSENWCDLDKYGDPFGIDMREVVIYRGEDGKLWVRPQEEFEDGRFEALPAAPKGDAR